MTASLEKIATLQGHTDRIWNLAWSPSGSILASCGGDKTIRLWAFEVNQWVCKAILEDSHQRTIRRVAWSPCGNFLASASFDATVVIWENKNGDFECIATLEGHENEVKGVAWDSSGALLATCSRDKSVWIWEMESNKEFECLSVLHGHSQDVKSIIWHPNKEMLVSCSYDDTIKLWSDNDDDWFCTETLTGHSSTVWDISFDARGERFVSCSDDSSLKIWQVSPTEGGVLKWDCISTISGYHRRCIFSVDWSKTNGLIATGAADDSIKIFQEDPRIDLTKPISFSCICSREKAHIGDVNCVAWHPKEPLKLASTGDDNEIKIWQLII
eukprot:TRINITY_DN602_c1_g1_i1.p1 TRINITY_DN602_c1_g1~~TRINITY_DN602_c1_g1_i1.p1  ORF type:complete len:328 (-),score=145.27 TRINITY_DN602_c1_g1_i1:18-1001(-)